MAGVPALAARSFFMPNALLALADPKDPFVAGGIAEEPLPGPVLSILAARSFTSVFLFCTPQTSENADLTVEEIARRHPACRVEVRALPISDPKDYSAVMGGLAREVRRIIAQSPGSDFSVCVSSGTAEMRAAWFLLSASGVLRARLLQVGSPAEPLFGSAAVKDVSLSGGDWSALRDLVMPQEYFTPLQSASPARAARKRREVEAVLYSNALANEALGSPAYEEPEATAAVPEAHPELEAALKELRFHIYSPKMRLLVETIEKIASFEEATLIQGETGTGKELVARLLHRLSPRRSRKLVTVNCAAIPQELAESHLFGHIKGAFTGAATDRKGYFEAADRGTLFLDEIGELSKACQAKMLRAIQFHEFERVGSTHTVKVDVRVIAATNRNLAELAAKCAFRQDLYQRLNILSLDVPPLRERQGEVVPLALGLLHGINAARKTESQLSKDALRRLESYPWPGNVRELDATLRRSIALAQGPILRSEDILIDKGLPAADALKFLPEPGPDFHLDEFLSQARAHLILRALDKAKGNQSAAAAMLGISKQAVSQFLADKRR